MKSSDQSVESTETVEKLKAGPEEIALARALTYRLPYLEGLLKDHVDPCDGFHMYLLATALPSSIEYNRIMLAHNGDASGVEFKRRNDGPYPDKYAVVMGDASQVGKFRIAYFDKSGFSSHHVEDTSEKAQQTMIREGFVIEDAGAMDRLASTKEWALGMSFADLIMRLNMGAISHARFSELQIELNNEYKQATEQMVVA